MLCVVRWGCIQESDTVQAEKKTEDFAKTCIPFNRKVPFGVISSDMSIKAL